jgi:hypothetical protein
VQGEAAQRAAGERSSAAQGEAAQRAAGERSSSAGPAAEEGIGRYLARQRQLRQISLDDLAHLTKIPRRSLERLESGAFDRKPDGFARGFVRTVAGALGLDPDETVMRLMSEPAEEPAARSAGAGARAALAGALFALAAFALVLLAWRLLAASPPQGREAAAPRIILREDPVRSLAREQAEEGATP